MKKNLLLGVSALLLLSAVAGCQKTSSSSSTSGANPLAGTYDITVWVSEVDGIKELTEQQIDEFEAANPGVTVNATVEGIGEANSATQMITDVESGADLYCFAQDQLARLVQVGALNPLGEQATKTVKELNDATAVQAATVNDLVYCYPMTSDNGYFMYYDKSVIKESSLDSLEAIIKDCEDAGKMFSFEVGTSGWYNASWFFATGCKSNWTTDNDGKFTSVDDNFNSPEGLIALKGMSKLVQSSSHVSSSAGADFSAAIPSAVVVTGTWEAKTIQGILGDNFGATDLPSFEVDGKSYHLGSFSGNKLMGVKPQTDAKKAAVLQQLALYLTNEKSQLERFDVAGWGPSNIAAQSADKIKADVALAALAKQNAYAVPQGQIHGSWWDICKSYCAVADKEGGATEQELKDALVAYEKSINGLFSMSEDEKNALGVVGGWEGGSWETDLVMEQKPAGTYYTTTPILLKEGDTFKVRQGKSWDVNWGANGEMNGNNITATADDAGYRYVKLVVEGETAATKDSKVTITLEKYNPAYSWGVMGSFNEWATDAWMTQVGEGEFVSDPIEFAANGEFKVRKGQNWDDNYGADGVVGGANIKVEAAGKYVIKLVITAEGATITATPAE